MAKVCAKPGCPNLQPCTRHKPTYNQRYSRQANQRYANAAYRRFKRAIRQRSGGKCEVTTNGKRCNSTYRVQPHHILPIADGGTHDPDRNGLDACGPHHAELDRQARRRRRQRQVTA